MMLMPSETGFPQQSLAVTRALGDHFFQQHGAPHTLGVGGEKRGRHHRRRATAAGATWEPSVASLDLFDVAGQLEQVQAVVN